MRTIWDQSGASRNQQRIRLRTASHAVSAVLLRVGQIVCQWRLYAQGKYKVKLSSQF